MARFYIGFFFIILFFLLSVPKVVVAAEGSLTIAPAVIEIVLQESEKEKTIEFTLGNNSNNAVVLDIFPVNFRSRGDYGQIGFDQIGTYNFPLVSYVIPEATSIELPPRQSKKLRTTIQNRSDLAPGGHYVALIAQLSKSGGTQGGTSNLYPALSSLILIRKQGGEQFNLSLKDINFPRGIFAIAHPQKITLLFQNEGNVHLLPYGRVEIRDIFGRLIKKGTINTSSLYIMPSSRRYLAVDLLQSTWSLPFSINSVEVKGRDSLNKTNFLLRETYVYVNPLLLPLVLVPFAMTRLRKRRKK